MAYDFIILEYTSRIQFQEYYIVVLLLSKSPNAIESKEVSINILLTYLEILHKYLLKSC